MLAHAGIGIALVDRLTQLLRRGKIGPWTPVGSRKNILRRPRRLGVAEIQKKRRVIPELAVALVVPANFHRRVIEVYGADGGDNMNRAQRPSLTVRKNSEIIPMDMARVHLTDDSRE